MPPRRRQRAADRIASQGCRPVLPPTQKVAVKSNENTTSLSRSLQSKCNEAGQPLDYGIAMPRPPALVHDMAPPTSPSTTVPSSIGISTEKLSTPGKLDDHPAGPPLVTIPSLSLSPIDHCSFSAGSLRRVAEAHPVARSNTTAAVGPSSTLSTPRRDAGGSMTITRSASSPALRALSPMDARLERPSSHHLPLSQWTVWPGAGSAEALDALSHSGGDGDLRSLARRNSSGRAVPLQPTPPRPAETQMRRHTAQSLSGPARSAVPQQLQPSANKNLSPRLPFSSQKGHSGAEVLIPPHTSSHVGQGQVCRDTPNIISASRYPSRGSFLRPTPSQLMEDGYYIASDESANSSFSDTPRSMHRMSVGSLSSVRTSAAYHAGDASSRARMNHSGVTQPANDAAWRFDSRAESLEVGIVDVNNEDEYDEEDEEHAVRTYMDSGTTIELTKAVDGEDYSNANLADVQHDIGESPVLRPSPASPPPPPLQRLVPSSSRASIRSSRSSAQEWRVSHEHGTPAAAGGEATFSKSPTAHPLPSVPNAVPQASLSPKKPSTTSQGRVAALSPSILTPNADMEHLEKQCRQLSLYEAFFLNHSRTCWLVDDNVLAKCLEFTRLMGYEHPALKRDRQKGQPSLWSSSSCIPSPVTRKKRSSSASAKAHARSAGDSSLDTQSGNQASTPSDGTAPSSKTYSLKAGKARCTAAVSSGAHLFLTFSEAMRWINEQEYVIGTILMCCARYVGEAEADGTALLSDGGSSVDGLLWSSRRTSLIGRPCIPVRYHPLQFVASLVCTRFPHWGGMPAFMKQWEPQIRLVLASAAPSHQRTFKCADETLTLSSDFEGGNLHRVERAAEPNSYSIWLEPDNGSDKRIWFRFAISGAREGRILRFRLMNAAPHVKLYRQNGMSPVWCDGSTQTHWTPVDQCCFRTTNQDMDGEVLFTILPRSSTETIQVAFCAPYTYADLLCHVCHWHALVKSSSCDMRFEERILCRSPEGRKLHLFIITSRTGGAPSGGVKKRSPSTAALATTASPAAESNASAKRSRSTSPTPQADGRVSPAAAATVGFVNGDGSPTSGSPRSTSPVKKTGGEAEVVRGPYANFGSGKKVVLISGRVHPGEVTASHGVHGIISFLLSSDVRAIQLREHFIFFTVPMLNPDGVSRGHSRLDQFGNNLNRCYNNPDEATQPTALALRRVFEHLQRTYRERFIMYLDFHSHASQSSGFMFGNNLPARVQHWNMFFPKLVELQARNIFSFSLCRFGRVHMTSKDGASRVLFGSSLIHSYTVELTHFTDRRLYADSFQAMNNGSAVVMEDTWPPMPGSGSAVSAGGEESGKDSSGRGAVLDGSSNNGGRMQSRTRSVALKAPKCPTTAGTSNATNGSAVPKQRRTQRSHSESAGTRAKSTTQMRKQNIASPKPRRRAESIGGIETGARPSGQGRSHLGGKTHLPQPSLQPISKPTILCQSALVGQACLLALRDYCDIGARPSSELRAYGGMERVLRDVKRQLKATSGKVAKPQSVSTYSSLQPIFRQY